MTSVGPDVSVIVATNRVGPYLDEALVSVRDQVLPPLEVILVDDGCTRADLARVIRRHPSVTVLHQSASGVSIARNRGVAASHGRYLAFLDDDDRWHPRRLAAHVRAHQAAPDAVASYCGLRSIDADGDVIAPSAQLPLRSAEEISRMAGSIKTPNLFVTRDAFERSGGFHSSIAFAEDLDLVLRLARLGDFVYVDEDLVDYRSHTHNTVGQSHRLVQGIDAVLRLHERAARGRGEDRLADAIHESIRKNDRYAWWAAERRMRRAWHDRRLGDAVREAMWALRTAPLGLFSGLGNRARRLSGRPPRAHPAASATRRRS